LSIYIGLVLSFVLVLVLFIVIHFDSVLVLVIVSKISLSIAILFYALVYDDDDDDYAGLSSGAGTKWEAHVRRDAPEFFLSCPPLVWLYKYNQSF